MRYHAGMNTYESHSLEETAQIAAEWLASAEKHYAVSDEALVVGLSGHLGAGKTAFVKAIAKEMGVTETVTSPTFVIMKIYETKNERWPRLVHIDAYRLERPEELEAIRWEALVADPKNLILMEWPENVGLKDFAKGAHLSLSIQNDAHVIHIE
jgi:tRNA threonylcarbamoyladenosine biosynthesis protein TsaE